MAKVSELAILNPADKTRFYSVAIGKGTPTEADDVLISDILKFPVGSTYTDIEGKKQYVRTAKEKASSDWTVLN